MVHGRHWGCEVKTALIFACHSAPPGLQPEMGRGRQLCRQFPCDAGSMVGQGCAGQSGVQSQGAGLGWEPRGVSCVGRRKAEPPYRSSHCVLRLWEMGRGGPGQRIWFQSPYLQCPLERGEIPAGSLGGGRGGCVCVFPAVPSVIPHERESPSLLHPCCLVAAAPGPKSPAAPSLMDHHGNGGAAPQASGQRGSGVCGEGFRSLEAAEQGLGCWKTRG